MLRDQGAFEVVWNGCPGPTGHGDELTEPLPESCGCGGSSLARLERLVVPDGDTAQRVNAQRARRRYEIERFMAEQAGNGR